MSEQAKCQLCGESMPENEQMFKYHGYSGPCPKPPLNKQAKETGPKKSEIVFAWAIEHQTSDLCAPRYFTGKRDPAQRWSEPGDHSEARRFARKQDAERIANFAGFYEPNQTHRICEHGWMD